MICIRDSWEWTRTSGICGPTSYESPGALNEVGVTAGKGGEGIEGWCDAVFKKVGS
jgi:hypothetical protein